MSWLKDKAVGDALDSLQFHKIRGSSIQRAEKVYLNFLIILGIGREEELRYSQFHKIHWQEMEAQKGPKHYRGDAPDLQRINQIEFLRLRLESLMRAIYEAASVVVDIVSAEAQKKPRLFDWSLKKFARGNPALLKRVDPSAVLHAWAVTEYRNKLISHHDFCRSYAFTSGPKGCRMCPMGPGVFPEITAEDMANTDRLWGTYGEKSEKPGEVNVNEKRRLLFHTVPVIQEGQFNLHREEVDKLVERYGTQSATLPEIGEAIRLFVLKIAEAL